MSTLTLISHPLCPYVQRAAIALGEKGVAFTRIDVDLAAKPDWFLALSPLGKTPVLKVGDTAIFESAVILEYLEDTQPNPLHPRAPLRRAEHRSLIEFGSALLNDIAGFYAAPDAAALEAKRLRIRERFAWLEPQVQAGPWFEGQAFTLVDAVYAPVFRYFDAFEQIGDFGMLDGFARLAAWRDALASRPSVRSAVASDYPERLRRFLAARGGALAQLMRAAA
jgi:glutathione S-transferase